MRLLPPPLLPSLSHTFSHSHVLSHTYTLFSLPHTLFSLSGTRSLPPPLPPFISFLSHSFSLSLSRSLSPSFSLTLVQSLPPSFSRHSHTFSLSLTHSLVLLPTRSLSLSLSHTHIPLPPLSHDTHSFICVSPLILSHTTRIDYFVSLIHQTPLPLLASHTPSLSHS